VAEEIYKKKKELFVVDKVKILVRDLHNGKLQLHTVVPIHELERRRQHKLRQLYLDEKAEKDQHQVTTQEVARRALARRKELERIRDEEQRKEERRLEEQRAEQRRAEERRAEQWREEQRRAEQRREEERREQQREEQRRAEERRAEKRREEQRRAEQRRAEERREQQKREEQRRAEEQKDEERRAEQWRLEERLEELRRIERRIEEQKAEQRRADELRAEQLRAEEQKKLLELEEASKARELRKDQQQQVAAEELLRRVTGETSTSIKFGQVKRQSVNVDDSVATMQNNLPMDQWYNSSGVPLRNSALILSNEQWRRSGTGTQVRPKSMDLLNSSTPLHTSYHRESPIGGYPSPPNHQPPSLSHSANPTRHQTRLTAVEKLQNQRSHTLGNHISAVVHPSPPQTRHSQLVTMDNGLNWNNKVKKYPNKPAPPPPPRREPYKTTYKNTEHGPTLYSMV